MATRRSFMSTNHGGRGFISHSSLRSTPQVNHNSPSPQFLLYVQSNCLERFREISQVLISPSKTAPSVLEARIRNPGLIQSFVNSFNTGVIIEPNAQSGVLLFNFPGYENGLAIVPDLNTNFQYQRGKREYSLRNGLKKILPDTKERPEFILDTFRTYNRLVREMEPKTPVKPLLIYKVLQNRGQ